MAIIDALKSKNGLITAASMIGAVGAQALLERRGRKMPDVVESLPGKAGDLMDDLGRGVSSAAKKATSAVRGGGSDDDDSSDRRESDGDDRGLDELAERRRQREERREQRRKAQNAS
jgi:hypothetical protein